MPLVALVQIILVIAVIGLILYLIENYIPMVEPFKIVIRVLVIIVVIIWLLSLIGFGVPVRFPR